MISSSGMSRRWFWFLFFTIVLIASVLRFWQLGHIPVSVYWDEVAMMVDIRSVLSTGLDMHGRPWFQLIYPSYGDYKLPVYIWAAIASSKIFGLSEFSLRLPSALAGIATIVIGGTLARVLLQIAAVRQYSSKSLDTIQLAVMAVIASSPWSVMFSRTAFEGHLGQTLLGFSILLAAWGLHKQKNWLVLAAAFGGALATYSYYSVRFVWLAVFIGLCVLDIFHQYQALTSKTNSQSALHLLPKFKNKLFLMVVSAVLFGVCLVPLLRSPLSKDADRFRLGTDSVLNNDELVIQSNLYREVAGNTRLDRLFYNQKWLLIRELLKNYSDNLSPAFLFVTGDPNLRHGTSQNGLFFFALLPIFAIGSTVLLKRHFPLAVFLLLWWLAALLPASVPENTPHALRSLNALIPLSITIGFGLAWLWQKLEHNLARGILVSILGFSLIQFWSFYTVVYPTLSANDWQSGFRAVAQSTIAETKNQQHVYLEEFDDRFYLWLMAYGPYDGNDFHQWQSNDYKFVTASKESNFANISFKLPIDERLAEELSNNQSVTLIGRTLELQAKCAAATLYTCQFTAIPDETGTEKFVIAHLQLHTRP